MSRYPYTKKQASTHLLEEFTIPDSRSVKYLQSGVQNSTNIHVVCLLWLVLYNKTIKKSRYHLGIKRSSEKLLKNNTWYRTHVDTSTGTFESGRRLPPACNLASRSPDKRLCQKNIFGEKKNYSKIIHKRCTDTYL
jgi:hypothetical protein